MTETVRRPPRNGVDVPTLFATLDAVKGSPQLAQFHFRATNQWVSGTHNRSAIEGFYGAGQEDSSRSDPFVYDADHPAVLVGTNQGPTPVEFLQHAIAACFTAGLANIAAARGVALQRVSSTVEGDIDLGILGLSDVVRNGYRQICVHFDVEGDASPSSSRRAWCSLAAGPRSTTYSSTAPMSRSTSARVDAVAQLPARPVRDPTPRAAAGDPTGDSI